MAEFTPLPGASAGVVGLLNVRGCSVPVVDPRPLLHAPPVSPHADQSLLLIAAEKPFALWVDGVDRIVTPASGDLQPGAEDHAAKVVLRLDAELIPVISTDALSPFESQNGALVPS